MFNIRSIVLGVAMAAAWAWGVSLMVGLTVIAEKGVVPFLIWATMNSLTLPIFGIVIRKLDTLQDLSKNSIFKWYMGSVQLFSIWAQMQAVYEASKSAQISNGIALGIAIASGLFFTILTSKNGINRSITTANIQWFISILGIITLILIGIINGETVNHNIGNQSGINWALYTWLILFCGPYVDLNGWQKARIALEEKRYNAFNIAGLTFGIYMLLVFILSSFVRVPSMSYILLLVAFLVATDTLVANTAALQELRGQKFGLILGLIAVCSWILIHKFGLLALWTTIGSIRIIVVVGMFIIAFRMKYIKTKKVKNVREII